MARKFRKKPVVIEAVQYLPHENCSEVASFQYGPDLWGSCEGGDKEEPPWLVETLEGVMEASPTDWIIKGIKGEFYPCRNDIFELTYEEVFDE